MIVVINLHKTFIFMMCHLMILKVSCLISYGYPFSKELTIILDKIGWMDGWMDG